MKEIPEDKINDFKTYISLNKLRYLVNTKFLQV